MDEILKEVQPVYKTFEDALPVIDKILQTRKSRWNLKALPYIDFDDVCQIVRIHLWKKWEQYDQTQKLEPWVARIVTRQIINLIRNIYASHSRPCLKCAENQGGDLCAAFGKQCSECPLFSLWERTKKRAFNVKLPVSMENHLVEVFEMPDHSIDTNKAMRNIFDAIKRDLTKVELEVFNFIYFEGLSDDEVAVKMGYIATETNRKPGYSRISQIKRTILNKVKEKRDDIDIF